MNHVVFNTADVEVLKQAMELEPSLMGEVIEIKDEWGVGPILNLDTDAGWNERADWWRMLLTDSPYGPETVGTFDDRQTVAAMCAWLEENPEEELWIWLGQNQHDVTGYYWLMPQLKDFQGRVHVLYLNNLPFINEKGQIFYPTFISEILPREAVKAKRLARAITLSEFEVDPDEWRRLSEENALVRILEGGKKIISKNETFYDEELLKNITTDWQKSWRILSNTLNRMKIKTGDVFVMWRLKTLISEEKLDVNGDPAKGWKDFEVKLKSNTPAAAAEE